MSYTVFSFGSNGSGQLGIGHDEDVSAPEPCIFHNGGLNSKPVHVAAGGNHTVLLCEDGAAYITGSSEGMLFDSRTAAGDGSQDTLRRIQFARSDGEGLVCMFRLCAATWTSTTLITEDNHVYTCGSGQKGELGQGLNVATSPGPQLLHGFPPENTSVVHVSSCMSHTVATLSNGEVYGWGNGRKGQLGEPAEVIWQPRKVAPVGFKALRTICGREFTCIFGDPEEGLMLVLGSDKANIKSLPPGMPGPWKDVGAAWGSAYILLDTGKLICWGRNNRGQLAPTGTPELKAFVAGSEHVLAQTLDGAIVAWGWGEHGNCGEEPDNPLASEKRCVTIKPPSGKFQLLGAGCATSWLFQEN